MYNIYIYVYICIKNSYISINFFYDSKLILEVNPEELGDKTIFKTILPINC